MPSGMAYRRSALPVGQQYVAPLCEVPTWFSGQHLALVPEAALSVQRNGPVPGQQAALLDEQPVVPSRHDTVPTQQGSSEVTTGVPETGQQREPDEAPLGGRATSVAGQHTNVLAALRSHRSLLASQQ